MVTGITDMSEIRELPGKVEEEIRLAQEMEHGSLEPSIQHGNLTYHELTLRDRLRQLVRARVVDEFSPRDKVLETLEYAGADYQYVLIENGALERRVLHSGTYSEPFFGYGHFYGEVAVPLDKAVGMPPLNPFDISVSATPNGYVRIMVSAGETKYEYLQNPLTGQILNLPSREMKPVGGTNYIEIEPYSFGLDVPRIETVYDYLNGMPGAVEKANEGYKKDPRLYRGVFARLKAHLLGFARAALENNDKDTAHNAYQLADSIKV